MAERKKNALNEDQIVEYLQDVVRKIRTEEDPFILNQYRRLFRKAVPFTLRSYFAAYLLKQIDDGAFPVKFGSAPRGDRFSRSKGGDRGDRGDRNDRNDRKDRGERNGRADRNDRNERGDRNEGKATRQGGRSPELPRESRRGRQQGEGRTAERLPPEPRNILPDDVSTTLFVSIGRNRRVFPRDLIGLIMQSVEMDRDHIGDIRVLDNYSFVQVITEDADKIIEALNEMEYRGRKLVVSHSRKREELAEPRSEEQRADEALAGREDGGFEEADSGDSEERGFGSDEPTVSEGTDGNAEGSDYDDDGDADYGSIDGEVESDDAEDKKDTGDIQ